MTENAQPVPAPSNDNDHLEPVNVELNPQDHDLDGNVIPDGEVEDTKAMQPDAEAVQPSGDHAYDEDEATTGEPDFSAEEKDQT